MAKPLPDGFNVDVVRLQLASYLANNPHSTVAESEPDDPWPFVKKPWGDESLEIRISHDDPALVTALNNLILPERFVAVWHRDTKELEIIYTAYPLLGYQKDMIGRKFTFVLGEKKVECEFAAASPRLMAIADNFFSVGMSNTNQRNLTSFRHYLLSQRGAEDVPKLPADATPICFWVRGFEWDEAAIADAAMHLNFYMTYFDIHSPTVNIFPPKQEPSEEKKRERYIAGQFPTEIRGREINMNLLHYWTQSRAGTDTIRKFLYAYQIIEYASFYFVKEE